MKMSIRRDAKIPAAYLSFVLEDQESSHLPSAILRNIADLAAEESSWIHVFSAWGGTIEARVSVNGASASEEALSFEEKSIRIDGIVDTIQQVVENAIRFELKREGWGGEEERTLST